MPKPADNEKSLINENFLIFQGFEDKKHARNHLPCTRLLASAMPILTLRGRAYETQREELGQNTPSFSTRSAGDAKATNDLGLKLARQFLETADRARFWIARDTTPRGITAEG